MEMEKRRANPDRKMMAKLNKERKMYENNEILFQQIENLESIEHQKKSHAKKEQRVKERIKEDVLISEYEESPLYRKLR